MFDFIVTPRLPLVSLVLTTEAPQLTQDSLRFSNNSEKLVCDLEVACKNIKWKVTIPFC